MFLLVLAAFTYRCCLASELKLYTKLLDGYEKYGRPVQNSSRPVYVAMGVAFQQIIHVDEKNQMIVVNVWLKLVNFSFLESWLDYKLEWDPEKYDGIRRLSFKKSELWTPDILLYNSVHREFNSAYPAKLVVYNNGLVKWIVPGIFKLSCTMNMAWFPFDEQHCFMKFGSWTYDETKLNLTEAQSSVDLSSYLSNGEWVLKSTSVERAVRYYQCCPEPYYDLKFKFTLQRRTTAYTFNLIIPCTLITMLTLFGFILPPEAGEKVSYQVSLMLTICIFQNYVSEMSPPTSEALPFLGAFFALCMVTVSVSIIWTVTSLNFYQRDSRTHYMSKTTRKLLLHWLPRILLMNRPSLLTAKPLKKKQQHCNDMQKRYERFRIRRGLCNHAHNATVILLDDLCLLTSRLNGIFGKEEFDKTIRTEWKFASAVIDRLCLWVFTLFMSIVGVALFLLTPQGA